MKTKNADSQPEVQHAFRFGTFVSFRDVYGRNPSMGELIAVVESFKQEQLLMVTTRLSLLLQSWMNEIDSQRQDRMIDILFPHSAATVKQVRRQFDVGLVFTRLGLLYFLRQVVQFGSEVSPDLSRPEDWEALGRALLMCNDLYLGYDAKPDDSVIQQAAGFLPAHEYLPPTGYMDEVARTVFMVDTILKRPEVLAHADYLDVNGDFEQAFGLSLIDFCSVIFGVVAHAMQLAEDEQAALQADIVIRPVYFSQTRLNPSGVEAVLRSLTTSVQNLKVQFDGMNNGTDLSPIQRQPLLEFMGGRLCIDPTYVFEKAGKAFFWVLRGLYDKPKGDRLLRFWGRVFESYHQWIWDEQYQGSGQFIPSPRYIDSSNEEIADAVLIEGDCLVLLECKASVITSEAKYSFNGAELGRELERKLVEDRKEKYRPKGVGQLARTILALGGDRRQAVPFSLHRIERIYSVLVTLDPMIEAPHVREHLNCRFAALRAGATGPETITPLFVMHIADLERLLRYTSTRSMSGILREFTRHHHEAKNFPGAIADYMVPHLTRQGVQPGRDTVGDRIHQIIEECRTLLPE